MFKDQKQLNRVYLIVLVIAAIILLVIFLWPQAAASPNNFGACLKERGVVFYGIDTCPNCKRQKDILGDQFQHVNYVNCHFHAQECADKGITFYPVWARDGEVLVGVQSLNQLSTFSGCKL